MSVDQRIHFRVYLGAFSLNPSDYLVPHVGVPVPPGVMISMGGRERFKELTYLFLFPVRNRWTPPTDASAVDAKAKVSVEVPQTLRSGSSSQFRDPHHWHIQPGIRLQIQMRPFRVIC